MSVHSHQVSWHLLSRVIHQSAALQTAFLPCSAAGRLDLSACENAPGCISESTKGREGKGIKKKKGEIKTPKQKAGLQFAARLWLTAGEQEFVVPLQSRRAERAAPEHEDLSASCFHFTPTNTNSFSECWLDSLIFCLLPQSLAHTGIKSPTTLSLLPPHPTHSRQVILHSQFVFFFFSKHIFVSFKTFPPREKKNKVSFSFLFFFFYNNNNKKYNCPLSRKKRRKCRCAFLSDVLRRRQASQ